MEATVLNVMCGICSEFFKTDDVVYSTSSCGHIFHKNCLLRWISRSPTCPQCRSACHRQRMHRIYLNFGERTALDDVVVAKPPYQWIPLNLTGELSTHETPEGAIQCGTDDAGNPTYVARVYYNDDLLPANYVPEKGVVYAPWNCSAHELQYDVDILVDCEHKWIPSSSGEVPPQAIPTGYSETGEILYTGRTTYDGITLLGKVHPSHRVMYMPHLGNEVNSSDYEVLVYVPKAVNDNN